MTNFPENVRILGHFLSGFCQDCQDIGLIVNEKMGKEGDHTGGNTV